MAWPVARSKNMQALQIRGQLDAIAGHDRRVRLALGDEASRAYRAQRREPQPPRLSQPTPVRCGARRARRP
jgi:hypothetical protein